MRDELRAFLESPRELRAEILRLRRQLDEDWELATKITPSYSGTTGGGGGQAGPKSSWTALAEYDDQLNRLLRERTEQLRRVEEFVDGLPTELYRVVLRYRYLNTLTWEQIEEMLSRTRYAYSERHIKRIHGHALQEARRLYYKENASNETTEEPEPR